MTESVFKESLKQSFKDKQFNELTSKGKNEHRYKAIEKIFLELGNRENRFIFYCPDIIIVNHIVKVIYDMAYALHKLNFNVVILHDTKGYKCNWILKEKKYSNYKNIKVEYIINKKSSKSKKEKNQYQFKPTDTLIVPDAFQDMFENIKEVTLIQKVVLVTSYVGITNLEVGSSYKNLNVSSAIFLEEKLKNDYEKLFPELSNNFIYPIYQIIDKSIFNNNKYNNRDIYPVIGLSKLGNEKLAQQVTNLFYNKFPKLRLFSFKILDRNNYSEYTSSLKHCCLYFNLDETLGLKQPLLEAMSMGIPTATYERRELEDNESLYKEIVVAKKDAFSIAEFLGNYCSQWLINSNNDIKKDVDDLIENQKIENLDTSKIQDYILPTFENLHQERVKFFASIKKTIEETGLNELESES